jgi:hypothetical protein
VRFLQLDQPDEKLFCGCEQKSLPNPMPHFGPGNGVLSLTSPRLWRCDPSAHERIPAPRRFGASTVESCDVFPDW